MKHVCDNNCKVFYSRKETGRATVTLTLSLGFQSYWEGNKASLTMRVATDTCHPLALLGHCSCQLHLAQLFPQCAFGLSRLSSAVRRLLGCNCLSAHRKPSRALILPQLLGNTTSMSPALPLLGRQQALLLKTAKTTSCPLNCALGISEETWPT